MDAYLAVASKRDQPEYAERPVPEDAVSRILDAGRIADARQVTAGWSTSVAQTVYAPPNLLGRPAGDRNLWSAARVRSPSTPGGRPRT